ncbi:MAG TPA: hypothetical protein VN836_10330 [Verrucomicrobiae bacterium]|nr:hypothetical protein [Verrucomicrobiae bacterium]
MRIETVKMAWFRGAASPVSLDTALKSVVAYGENGAGKSSFVDAVEFLMSGGKIRHLAHEYSGRRQEKAIVNTHIPKGENAKLTISVASGARAAAEMEQNGKYSCSGVEAVSGWDYGRTILRQDEVAAFIHGTKGEKYSALTNFSSHGQIVRHTALIWFDLRPRSLLMSAKRHWDFSSVHLVAKVLVLQTQRRKSGFSVSAEISVGDMERDDVTTLFPLPSVEIYTDGGCEPNPGLGCTP